MNALTLQSGIKRGISSISEIWFLLLFILLGGINLCNILMGNWHPVNTIAASVSVFIIALLLFLLFRKNSWISFYLGLLFASGSSLAYLAVLSEFKEFPLGTEPGALNLIIGGSLFCGTSFFLAIRMMMKGIHKICTN